MEKKKVFKIIISIIFIPLIVFFSLGIIAMIGRDMKYFFNALVIDSILIVSYLKLKNEIESIGTKEYIEKKNQKEIKRKLRKERKESRKLSRELQKIEQRKWKKLFRNFYISEEYEKIRVNRRDIPFSQIMNAEILEDNTVISKTTGYNKSVGQKHTAPVKAALGAGLFGGVGAIIGGTSGKITTKTKIDTTTENIDICKSLSIKIQINDINNPLIIYKIIKSPISKDTYTYEFEYEAAQKCIAMLQVIINSQ